MLRSFYRVLVVSVFALSLVVGTPAVQAQRESPVQVKPWIEEVGEWLIQLLGKQPKAIAKLEAPDFRVTHSGPCIDPLGKPKPCA